MTHDPTVTIRPAVGDDAAALSQLASTTFCETFEAGTSPDDMSRYLAESFTEAQQASEIADPASIMLVAEHRAAASSRELVGYAHLVAGPAPHDVQGPSPIELKRLYVVRTWHGRRVAQALMDASIEAARERGAQTLWLGVWEQNARALTFYAKYGFTRVGEHTFALGGDLQTDWLFARSLA